MTVGLLSFVSFAQAATALSQRNVINLNNFSFGVNDYAFIDHIKSGVAAVGPVSNGYNNPAVPTFPSLLDSDGWPNDAAASGVTFGGGFNIPDPANFGGPYVVDMVGNGVVDFNQQGPFPGDATMTVGNGSNGMPAPVNCTATTSGGGVGISITTSGGASPATIYFTLTSTSSGSPLGMNWHVRSTGASGFFLKNIRFYRSADAADLAAGKIWRSAWKQPLVDLDPSAIRCMNNLGGNSNLNCRFENRTLPSSPGYCQYSQWDISPSYSTNATSTNQYTVAAATPTTGNPKNTPASMLHGEIATVRFTNGFARCTTDPATSGGLGITSITNAANGQVTTAIAHGFNTGDVIVHQMTQVNNIFAVLNSTTTVVISDPTRVHIGMFVYGAGIQAGTTVANVVGSTVTLSLAATISASGVGVSFACMNNLHMFPCTITVTGSTTYNLNVDTTSFGPFFGNLGAATQFITVQVGSGNDRVSYPLMFGNVLPASLFGAYLSANDYKTLYFDKTISGQTDGSGNYILGAWIFPTTPGQGQIAHSGDFPIEVLVALINELNAMSPAHTIGMWMNIPCWGLSTMDPDYTTASDWAKNAIDVVINPSSTVRASGYSALGYSGATQLNQPNLIVEYSNELWPSGTNDGRLYLIASGIQRFGQSILPMQDWQDMKALRSTCWVRDVKSTNPPGASRIKYVIGIWGNALLQPGGFGGNYETIFGGNVTANPNYIGDWYTNDSLVVSGGWGTPISNHDGVCAAAYFDPPDAYCGTSTGTGTFTDDSAMYNGTDNSGNGGGNYTGAANPTQAITNFVAQVVDVGSINNQSITRYATEVWPQEAGALPAGKVLLGYEGGADWQVTVGANQGGHTLTANDELFARAALDSPQWATAQVGFFNTVSAVPNSAMPSVFISIGGGTVAAPSQRWAYCAPDSYATISGTPTEGAALTVNSPVWIAMGNRNRALTS